jgi:hypothetical protein
VSLTFIINTTFVSSTCHQTYVQVLNIINRYLHSQICKQAIEGINTTVTTSSIGSLSNENLLMIIDYLTGNDQIMVALTCKYLAAVVEASETRNIANIVMYSLAKDAPAIVLSKAYNRAYPPAAFGQVNNLKLAAIIESDKAVYRRKWQLQGFEPYTLGMPWNAIDYQHNSLRKDVGKWLGSGYRYCNACEKYRVVDKNFWLAFAHYENPGIVERAKDMVLAVIDNWEDVTMANWTRADWMDILAGWTIFVAMNSCPAHVLLREVDGKRLIELKSEPKSEEVKVGDKKAAKTTKKVGNFMINDI